MTVTVCPAIVSVPVREGPVAAATLNVTVPEPLPPPPEVIASHGWLLVAVQPQPSPALTLTLRVPPPDSTVSESGETARLHPGDCVTVNGCPAIVAVPVRVGPLVDATATDTLPLPLPDNVLSVSQGTVLDAVQGQPALVVPVTS